MRVLITGSRDWRNAALIYWALDSRLRRAGPAGLVVVQGACPTGADLIAERWAETARADGHPVVSEEHPADWDRLKKRSGMIRSAEMVQVGADVCLAFIRNRSAGATGCARLALDAGIELHVWRES
ncbi:SLOG family protein [Frankia sp. AgB32]|uniref:SLOG family protein n=1 Tax=Frankia sp. AgB32 TaxID=631119 RepID=UPI0034D5396E